MAQVPLTQYFDGRTYGITSDLAQEVGPLLIRTRENSRRRDTRPSESPPGNRPAIRRIIPRLPGRLL